MNRQLWIVGLAVVAMAFAANSEGNVAAKPHAVLELRHGPGNPRNSEGDFAVLKDGHILFAYSKYTGTSGHDHAQCVIAARESSDRGETWSGDRILAVNKKDPQGNVMSVSLLRLKSGKLALFYIVKESAADGRITSSILMKTSADEGKTWSSPRDCSFICPIAYRVLNNARIVRLKSGRVLIPLAEHRTCPEGGDKVEGSAHLFCLYSDDDCATWKMSEYVPHPPRHCQQEPGVIELKDGRVMMWYRTGEGRQWQAFSSDAGHTWSAPEPSTMYSPCSPATIVRLKSGQLLGVWNDHENRTDLMISNRKGRREPARTPLTVGLSSDDGCTWPRRCNLEDGFDQAHGRRYWYCYTAVLELEDRLLIAYCAENGLSDSRITSVPLEWVSALPYTVGKPAEVTDF